MSGATRGQRSERIITYTILIIGAFLMALPFYYMVVTSLKPMTEVSQPNFSLIVRNPTLQPYRELIDAGLILRATGNSLITSALLTAGSLFFCCLAGYAFAKHRFPGRETLFLVLLATMMIPGTVLLVPGFLLFRDFGWLDTWAPLIIPGLAGAFGVFLARQFIEKIPDSLIESAKLEGLSEWRIFLSIILWIWTGANKAPPADRLVLRAGLLAALLHSGFDNTLISSTALMQFSFFYAAMARAKVDAREMAPRRSRHGRREAGPEEGVMSAALARRARG
jgi:ABC-type spermidine/putrescine transport system permease subunit II